MAGEEKEIRAQRRELRKELRGLGIQSVVLEYGKHFNRLFRFLREDVKHGQAAAKGGF